MGRKIPGKKHRGVKDPEKQRRNRLQSVADKVNAPPNDPDEQNVSSSLKRIMELKEIAKKPRPKPRPKPPLKYVQKAGESDNHFLYRIGLDCQNVLKEKAYEEKYRVKIKKDPLTGKVQEVVKADKDELVEYMKQIKKGKKSKAKKPSNTTTENEVKLSKSQKRKRKLLDKKQQQKEEYEMDNFEVKKDHVEFGEVVHAPPVLTAPKYAQNGIRKPGKKDLLMKSMLSIENNKQAETCKKPQKNSSKTTQKVIDKKSKRKLLPVALRRQLEKNQKEIIEAYRQLKADRIKK